MIVVQFKSGDGFLNKVFGTEPQALTLDAGLAWSSRTGLTFALTRESSPSRSRNRMKSENVSVAMCPDGRGWTWIRTG